MSTFEQQLRKVCKNCKPSSLKTYHANIKALARLAKLDSVPTNKRWLTSSLLKHVKSMPLQKYKRFSMAGVKALQAYGAKDQGWDTAMRDSTEKYSNAHPIKAVSAPKKSIYTMRRCGKSAHLLRSMSKVNIISQV